MGQGAPPEEDSKDTSVELRGKGVNATVFWVTDNLLAMSRPNSANIATTISEFRRLGIKSIVNVQVTK